MLSREARGRPQRNQIGRLKAAQDLGDVWGRFGLPLPQPVRRALFQSFIRGTYHMSRSSSHGVAGELILRFEEFETENYTPRDYTHKTSLKPHSDTEVMLEHYDFEGVSYREKMSTSTRQFVVSASDLIRWIEKHGKEISR